MDKQVKEYKSFSKKKIWITLIVAGITLCLTIINLLIGPMALSPQVLVLRLPHILTALLTGATLGICGCILQSSLGNPLASPSTIGISQGAACGACISIIAFGASLAIVPLAFIFALLPTALIFFISKLKQINSTAMILAGVAMSIFFGGLVAIIEYFADSSQVAEVVFWTFGSVYNTNIMVISVMAIALMALLIYAIFNHINFNAMECGDMTAHTIGIDVNKQRVRHLILAAAGAAIVTAFCGTINFIGLIAPHVMRKFVGANYKYLIPTSALCGACIVTISDILSAIILPGAILPIGAITSFIGAPIFIYVLLKKK